MPDLQDLAHALPLTTYAAAPTGGPKKLAEAVIGNADEYRKWLGDVGDAAAAAHDHLDGVDFARELLIAVGLGEVQLGTTVAITSVTLVTGGIMGGTAVVRYAVTHPHGNRIGIVGTPYAVVKAPIFSGYAVRFLRSDVPGAVTTFALGEEGPAEPRHGPVTTFALGEEGGALVPKPVTWTTLRFGEEGPATDPRLDDPAAALGGAGGTGVTTLALGEEGGPGPFGTF